MRSFRKLWEEGVSLNHTLTRPGWIQKKYLTASYEHHISPHQHGKDCHHNSDPGRNIGQNLKGHLSYQSRGHATTAPRVCITWPTQQTEPLSWEEKKTEVAAGLVSLNPTYCKYEHVCETVQSPEVRSPVRMAETSLEGKQTRQNLAQLTLEGCRRLTESPHQTNSPATRKDQKKRETHQQLWLPIWWSYEVDSS